MTLTIVPNEFTQPDLTVLYTAPEAASSLSAEFLRVSGHCEGNALFWSVVF